MVNAESLQIPSKKEPFTLDHIAIHADSPDFYPLVDFHLLEHVFQTEGRFLESQEPPKTRREALIWFILNRRYRVHSAGPNIGNYLLFQNYAQYRGLLERDADFVERFRSSVHAHQLTCKEGRGEEVIRFLNRSRTAGRYQFTFGAWFSRIPFLRRYGFFQTPHMMLQERFNEQTQKSRKAHHALEDLLKTNLTRPDLDTVLDDTQNLVDYDFALFYSLESEWRHYYHNVRDAFSHEGSQDSSREAMRFYDSIHTQPRTTSDLARNMVMRYVLDAVRELRKIHRDIANENQTAGEIFAERFMQNIDLNEYIYRFVQDRTFSILPGYTFDKAYNRMKDYIEQNLRLLQEPRRFARIMHRIQESENPEFLLETLRRTTDTNEFRRRENFEGQFGKIQDPEEVYEFWNAHKDRIAITPQNLRLLIALDQGKNLEEFLQQEPKDQGFILDAVREGYEDVVLNFLRNYQEYRALVGDLRKHIDLKVEMRDRDMILAQRDYGAMEEFLDFVVAIETERENRETYQRLKTPFPADHPSNEDVQLLIIEAPNFVKPRLRDLAEVRRRFIRNDNGEGYIAYIQEMLDVNQGQREQRLIDLLKQPDTVYVKREELPKKQLEGEAIETERESAPGQQRQEPQKPYLSRVVIVGGYRRADYKRRLAPHFNIGSLTVIGSNAKARLAYVGSDTVYLHITGNTSHAVTERLAKKEPEKYVKVPTSGTRTLVEALMPYAH